MITTDPTTGIARIAETHAAMGRLPAPQLPERQNPQRAKYGAMFVMIFERFLVLFGGKVYRKYF